MKKIIGILGKPGAGKDTFCKCFQEIYSNIAIFKFSDPLFEVLGIFFDKIKREDLQWLANQLRDKYGEDILAKAIKKKIKHTNADFILLNGLRVWDEYQMLKEISGKLVFIDADPKKRWERIIRRREKEDDDISFDKFLELDQQRSEREIMDIAQKADFVINNNRTRTDLKKQVVDLVEEYK